MGIDNNMMRTAVFLDRDGVINRAFIREGKPYPPSSIDQLEILPGVRQAIDSLKAAGYFLVVVTNQPDVARGILSKTLVESINNNLKIELGIDDFRTCFHDDSDLCECRKPKPGLLKMAAKEFEIDLDKSILIGDRWRDIEAGKRAGCKTIFIDYSYLEKQPESYDFRVKSLLEAATKILCIGELK